MGTFTALSNLFAAFLSFFFFFVDLLPLKDGDEVALAAEHSGQQQTETTTVVNLPASEIYETQPK